MIKAKLNPILAGVSGEYFVAAELSRRGYIASITLRNTRGVDILVTTSGTNKTFNIQVKTNQGKKRYWLLSSKHEKLKTKNSFYVFVNLNEGLSPDFFIVPNKTVANFIRISNEKFLKEKSTRKGSDMRKFEDKLEAYLNRWDLIR